MKDLLLAGVVIFLEYSFCSFIFYQLGFFCLSFAIISLILLGQWINTKRSHLNWLFTPDVSGADHPILKIPRNNKIARGLVYHGSHRGGMPENTYVAFKKCLTTPVSTQVLEVDLRRTKDNKIVLLHDAMLDRTTNMKGKLSDFTLDEIKDADAAYQFTVDGKEILRGKGERIPVFSEFVKFFVETNDTAILMLDFKDKTIMEDALKIVSDYNLENRLILGAVPAAGLFYFLRF